MNAAIAPYGTWTSPLTAARVTAGLLRFDHLVADGDDLYWAEGRAAEGGRVVVVRRTAAGDIRDVTPDGFNVRTRVHEYGGAAYTVHDGTVYFSNFADQRVYCQAPGERPRPISRPGYRYAAAQADPRRRRLVAVREDHTHLQDVHAQGGESPEAPGMGMPAREPINTLAALAWDGTAEDVLVSGADFYANPTLSPDGRLLAWLEWHHPNMPWDGTELRVASVENDGALGASVLVAGGVDEAIFQPEWLPDGRLVFVSDRSGWWNLYCCTPGGAGASPLEPLWPMEADFGKPLWTFSQSSYCVVSRNELLATYTQRGRWHLARLQLEPRRFDPIPLAFEPTDGVQAAGEHLYALGGGPTQPMSVVRLAGGEPAVEMIRGATADRLPAEWISVAEPITFESAGRAVHAFYYAPHSPAYAAPAHERPPLLVVSHGGPTAASTDVLDARIQFWTSRGFAVLDVNYSGSTGFGRAYRDRLKGGWGVVDVEDCVNGARAMVAAGRADGARLAIRGGSAGGYTTLAALAFHDAFRAGASHYGVSDLEVLARDTHKFEARYLDSLVGPYPAARDVYRARSPLHAADRVSAALILFQGLEDRIVPPNQSEMMAEAVRRKGLPVAYVPFEGEQHGFRRRENIIRSLEAELFFYGAVFGFSPADAMAPVAIDNLRR